MLINIPLEVKDYYKNCLLKPESDYQKLTRRSSYIGGKQVVHYSLAKNPKFQRFCNVVLSCCCCCSSSSILQGKAVKNLLEEDLQRKSLLKQKFRQCVRRVIASGIGSGIAKIHDKGYTGTIMQPKFWQENLTDRHYGPDFGLKLFIKWERSQTHLSFYEWTISSESQIAKHDLFELLRSHLELCSEEKEIHPETGREVHRVDINKISVKRLTPEQRKVYRIQLEKLPDGNVRITGANGYPIVGKFAFAIGPDCEIYAGRHIVNHFHHSTFFNGGAVIGVGKFITDENGVLTHLNNDSGHYRPSEIIFRESCSIFEERGIDFSKVQKDFIDWNDV